MGLSNLPPGVTDSMIPGNRPEDEEIEIPIILTIGEIDDLRRYLEEQRKLPITQGNDIYYVIENIVEQLEDYS